MVRSKLGNGEFQWPQVEMALIIIPLIDFGLAIITQAHVTVSRQDGTGAGRCSVLCKSAKKHTEVQPQTGGRYGTDDLDVMMLSGCVVNLTLSYYASMEPILATANAMPVYLFTGTDVDPNPNTFAGGSWNNRRRVS